MHVHQDLVRTGDRLIELNGQTLEHQSLSEVISLLLATHDKPRDLVFSRTPSSLVRGLYDVGKIVQVEVSPGPLGLHLHQSIGYCAIVDTVLDTSPLKGHVGVHCGSRVIRINDQDVSTKSREAVVALLGQLKDQKKTIEFYSMAPPTCTALVQVEVPTGSSVQLEHLTVTSVASVDELRVGDVVVAVNDVDLTTLDATKALAVWNATPFPKRVISYRTQSPLLATTPSQQASPYSPTSIEVIIADSSLGLNVDSAEGKHVLITGFATPADAQRSYYQPHRDTLPGRFVASVNGIDVSSFPRDDVLGLLGKLALVPKTIALVTSDDMAALHAKAFRVMVDVAPGSLGVDFDGNCTNSTVLSGFRPVNGSPGALERSGVVGPGSVLVAVNHLNVSRLPLHQTIDLLKKLTDVPKRLTFVRGGTSSSVLTQPFIDVSVPPGSIGVALNSSIASSTVVQGVTPGSAVDEFSGIRPGSVLVAVDGFDVTTLPLAKTTELLRALSGHRKVLSFTTSEPIGWPTSCVAVAVPPGPLGLEFDSAVAEAAIVQGFAPVPTSPDRVGVIQLHGGVALGSRLVAVDGVDVRSKSLMDITAFLRDVGKAAKTLRFLLPHGAPSSPKSSPPMAPLPRQHSLEILQKQISLTDDQVQAMHQRRVSDTTDSPPLLRVYKDQKNMLVHEWDGKLKSINYTHQAVSSFTRVTKGKAGFSKKHASSDIDDNLCLSIGADKSKSYDYIAASMEDRDALAGLVESLIRTKAT
ncbi:hypothetical protein DYB36_002109 [Aphanomyces astaci]|uniref:PDZ domain-containing protein n=1 Tax=Aphanomyces astaci TaxID=112090 RepID=A0A397AV04_APHAT|nr:hypothetical protein DYB36_002109 [Aphanomyces astaci]